jgi:hypothetical protein
MDWTSRTGWGAREATARTVLPAGDVRGMAVHYSAAEADRVNDPNDCASRVRGIQRHHMDGNGWNDIAYNFLVCVHGTIYEGRGWGIRSAANGTNDSNDHYLAVCFLGADKEGRDDVGDLGRSAIHELVAECRRRYQQATEVRPHSAFRATACPGGELRAWAAAGLPLDAGPVPPPAPGRTLRSRLMEDAPTLRPGAEGHHVKILQALLMVAAGDLVGDPRTFVDGKFGPMTDRVLSTWQARTSLGARGVCDGPTWAWLCGV